MNTTMSLSVPPHGLIEYLRMTDANNHSGARLTVANWIVEQLREQVNPEAADAIRKAL